MLGGLLRWVNVALTAVFICVVTHFVFRWNELRPRVVDSGAPNCRETLDDDAYYLALICKALIDEKGSLPQDSVQLGRAISENASRLGFTWPNNFKINSSSEICDCNGQPFKIAVLSDRIAVTSASLSGIYFAELKKTLTQSQKP